MEAILEMDGQILMWIQENLRNDILTPVMQAVTKLGDYGGLFWILIALTLLIISRTRRVGLNSALALASMGIINNLGIKLLVNRTRPYEILQELEVITSKPHDSSFPSGHTAVAFAMSTVFLLTLPKIMEKKVAVRISIGFYILSALLAFSRLYLGVHFPTDVLAGILLGIGGGILGSFVGNKIWEHFQRKNETVNKKENETDVDDK
ncbi:MAG TPA: phosphatase PAP2 family protein [Lachnospiraceae bacterium]|nr:phosphatase PAP2 family protein [Lachnospiraceae bacterium]